MTARCSLRSISGLRFAATFERRETAAPERSDSLSACWLQSRLPSTSRQPRLRKRWRPFGVLEPLSGPGGLLKLDIYEQPTRDELADRLKSSDIFHFIGHGGFAVMGSDPTSQAHVSLIRPDTNESDYLFASDLANMLNNTEVQLVVFTACTSSESTPDEGPFRIGAFDGMAQRLLSGVRGVTAAVAMQFDMEAEAAVAFSKKLYKHLLDADKTLAEVVTLARSAVSICKGVGHRAWVTPTVYCRCEGGHVFRLATPGPVGPGPVTPPVTREYDVSGSWKYRCKGINRDLEHGGTCRIEFTHASFGVPCKVIGRRLWGVRSRQCQGFPRNPGRFHPGSGLSPSLDQLGAIEREASFL